MADIQQWRRKIHNGMQPARSRTPAQTTPVLDTDQYEDYFSVPSPRRRLKPKLSSYFTHTSKTSLQDELAVTADLPTWPPDELYPSPQPEIVMDALMCRIMSSPLDRLDASHNSSLMLIFEAYMKLKDENEQLHSQMQMETRSTEAIIAKFNMAEKDWEDDRQGYKNEIKRLEVLLAKLSRRGVAEVTLARQDSRFHGREGLDRKETVFEFLEKTKRYDPDQSWSSQRATMKPLMPSPSDKDTNLSKTLAQKKSMTNIHAELPFGTPPQDSRFSLINASMPERNRNGTGRERANTASTYQSTSTDTFSTFSCEDLLPTDDQATKNKHEMAGSDDDFASVQHIAHALAQRRNVDANRVLPQLMDLFNVPSRKTERSASVPVNAIIETAWPQRISSVRANVETIVPKHRTVMSKASGFFQKLKPQQQLPVEASSHSANLRRRFSFEPGDDTAAHPLDRALSGGLTPTVKDRVLRKSVSLYALVDPSPMVPTGPLSPIAHSPTPSAVTTEGRPASRIPTPVRVGSLARPRSDREDSASSLLTVIRHADASTHRTNSLTGSDYSSLSTRPDDQSKAAAQPQQAEPGRSGLKSSSSNRLLDHTNALRGTTPAQAAARGALGELDSNEPRSCWKSPGARSYRSVYSPDTSDIRGENAAPIG